MATSKTFNVSGDRKIRLCRNREEFTVKVEQHKLTIDGIGSVNSKGDYFKIDPNNLKHHCGAHGFGKRLNDHCPACEENSRRSEILHAAYAHAAYRCGVISRD